MVLNDGSCTSISIPFLSESPTTLKVRWSKLRSKFDQGTLKKKKDKKCEEAKKLSQEWDLKIPIEEFDLEKYEVDEDCLVDFETTEKETSMVLKEVHRATDEGLYEACLQDEFGEGKCLVCVHVRGGWGEGRETGVK